jgi:hypothetical protein
VASSVVLKVKMSKWSTELQRASLIKLEDENYAASKRLEEIVQQVKN